jgi:hypothetical protein
MKIPLPKDFEFLLPVELTYLDIIKNEDEFVQLWKSFKKNNQKSLVTNTTVSRFYDDCEKFTESILKTRIANKELDQDLHYRILSIEKLRRCKKN